MQTENVMSEGEKEIIQLLEWKSAPAEIKKKIIKRSQLDVEAARQIAREWIAKIQQEGDKALLDYIRTFDDANFDPQRLRVTKEDIALAYSKVDKETTDIIRRQIEISREFHQRQLNAVGISHVRGREPAIGAQPRLPGAPRA